MWLNMEQKFCDRKAVEQHAIRTHFQLPTLRGKVADIFREEDFEENKITHKQLWREITEKSSWIALK